MPIIMDPYERFDQYRDTALDLVIEQIKIGNIRCGKNAAKLNYGNPPTEVKGWWLTNDRHRDDKPGDEPTRDQPEETQDKSKPRKRKENIVELLRELDRRRNGGKR